MLQSLSLPLATMLVAIPTARAEQVKGNYAEETDKAAPGEDTGRPSAWRIDVVAGTAEKQAKVSVDLLRLGSTLSSNGDASSVSEHSLELSISSPWDKKADALPATLDGLANGTKVSLDYSFWGSKRRSGYTDVQTQLLSKAIALCLADGGKKVGATPATLSEKCSEKNDSAEVILYLSDKEQREYVTGSFEGGITAFSLTGSIGTDDYTFADPVQLALSKVVPIDQHKTGWSIGGRFSYYFPKTPTALALGVDYEHAWEGGDDVSLCAPLTGSVLKCTSIAPAAPTLRESVRFSANLRHRFFIDGRLSNFAISPRFTYAMVNGQRDVWGAELPFYLIPNGDGGLTGGVKLGYRSDTDKVTFGLFVGMAFGLVQ